MRRGIWLYRQEPGVISPRSSPAQIKNPRQSSLHPDRQLGQKRRGGQMAFHGCSQMADSFSYLLWSSVGKVQPHVARPFAAVVSLEIVGVKRIPRDENDILLDRRLEDRLNVHASRQSYP